MTGLTATTVREYTLRDFLTVVFKRKRLILAFFLTLVAIVAAGSFLSPKTYEVKASILVKKARAEVPLTPTASSQLFINEVTEEELNSEMEILKSRRLIEDVVRSLNIEEEEPKNALQSFMKSLGDLVGNSDLSFQDEMVLHLQKEIKVQTAGRSNVIEVSYRSTDREFAANAVNALTARYLEWRTEVFQSPQALSFFEEQMKNAEMQLAEAEERLEKSFEDSALTRLAGGVHGSDSLAAQKSLLLQQLGELENELAEADVRVRESEETVTALQERFAKEPQRLPSSDRWKLDPTVEEIERGLVTLQLERDALVQDFQPDSRQVRDIDEQIRLARKRLAEAQERAGSIDRTEINSVHQELKGELLRAEAELEGARTRHASLIGQVSKYRRDLRDLNQKGFVVDKLTREAKTAEEAYLLYKKKFEEARISAGMDQQKLVNVSIAQPAERPLTPVAPKTTLNLFLAVFLGLFGGLAAAFAAEYFDHSFTTGEDLVRHLGVPILASIPEQHSS
jgi:uncharacterized protein involved in exopolysaccharide biosynthesis